MIYNYVFIGFNSISNLIVFCSIISWYFCWIYYKDWVWEFGEDLWRKWSSQLARDWLVGGQPAKGHVRSTCWNLNNFCQAVFCESLLDSSQVASDPWNSLLEPFWNVFFSFFYQHYISPHYPQNCKELLREKTLSINLRVRNCKLTIIYIISLSFPLLLPLQLQILERF